MAFGNYSWNKATPATYQKQPDYFQNIWGLQDYYHVGGGKGSQGVGGAALGVANEFMPWTVAEDAIGIMSDVSKGDLTAAGIGLGGLAMKKVSAFKDLGEALISKLPKKMFPDAKGDMKVLTPEETWNSMSPKAKRKFLAQQRNIEQLEKTANTPGGKRGKPFLGTGTSVKERLRQGRDPGWDADMELLKQAGKL
jgi:hypothetical protein